MNELNRKIENACRLLRLYANGDKVEIAYSGGKDSDILLWLARQSGIDFVARYKNTTIDPPGTISHCKENGVEILHPKRTFLQIVESKGFPSRFARFCCEELKEYTTDITKVVTGVRREESRARANRYKEPTSCFRGVERLHPILDWTTNDIAELVNTEKIQLHPLYYDEDGNLDLSRRLGCIGCPLASNRKRIADYKRYPKLLAASIRALSTYYEKQANNGKVYKLNDAKEKFLFDLFYSHKMTIDEFKSRIEFGDEINLFEQYFGI